MVRRLEQPRATAVAREKQGASGPSVVSVKIDLQQLVQILVGRGGVADVELDGLADTHSVGNRNDAAFAIHADDIANQEIAAQKLRLVLAEHAADVQTMPHQSLILRRQLLP